MKKLIRLAALLLATLLLAGCSGSGYRFVDNGDNSYITGIPAFVDDGSLIRGQTLVPEVRFSSVAEMKQDILSGNFTEAEQKQLEKFYHDEKNRIPVFSLSDLYDVTFPTTYPLNSVVWNDATSKYYFAFNCLLSEDSRATLTIIKKATFDDEMKKRFPDESNGRQTILSVEAVSDRNAAVVMFAGPGGTFTSVTYTVVDGNRTLYVTETYEAAFRAAHLEYIAKYLAPDSVSILIDQETVYAEVYISFLPKRPTLDEIKAFGLVPFADTETA